MNRCGLCPHSSQVWLIVAAVLAFLVLSACTKTVTVPGPVVEVKVPVPVPCKVEQVAPTERLRTTSKDVYDLAKTVAADRRQLMAENERLRAANANPCGAQ